MKTCPICETAYPNEYTSCGNDGALLVQAAELDPGTMIRGKYRIQRTLGRGGMGTVYLAEHLLLRRAQALKFISSDLSRDVRFVKRFRHEAQAAIELRHPNIIEVVDLDQAEDGTPYIAMEFVDGQDLRTLLTMGPLAVERALSIARGVALGLGAAHAKGVVHRDIKPENVLLARGDGQLEIPKIADFGIAFMNDTASELSHTQSLMLTPDYAAPEQWRGMAVGELDGRADLYALGGLLYEMLTGYKPFNARTAEGWMYEHLHKEPAPPSELRKELAGWKGLDALVLRLLAKDRDARTPSAAAFLESLDRVCAARPQPKREPLTASEPAETAGKKAAADVAWDEAQTSDEDEREHAGPAPRWLRIALIAFAALAVAAVTSAVLLPLGMVDGLARNADQAGHSGLAMPLYKVACTRGDGHACSWLGAQYSSGAAGPADPATAADYYSRACDDGDVAGCIGLAQGYEFGQGVMQNYSRAVEIYQRDCDLGDPNGCAGLGRMYERGEGVAQDYSHAITMFARACEQNSADGCEGLGRSYRDGNGVKPDLNMATSLFEKARRLTPH
jgi:serine/threonine protein kinase